MNDFYENGGNAKLQKMSGMFMELFHYTDTFIMDNLPPNDNIYNILSKLHREREEQELFDYYAEIDDKYESRLNEPIVDDTYDKEEIVDTNYESDHMSSDNLDDDTEGWTTV